MSLLLDTNALLWWLDDRPTLGKRARRRIEAENGAVFVSAITAAEIAVKSGIGKLQAPDDLEDALATNAFMTLPLSVRHALRVKYLPRHHGDPFDRLLIAQALCEDLTIVTGDTKFTSYDVPVIDAHT